MARPLRVNLPNAWYHIMGRGNGGELLFRSDTDRRRFLGLLAEVPERFSLEIHAFVLMDNHYHLLLRCGEANLSDAIRWLQVSYAGRFNWAHRRRGHVFQGRFKSVLILEEESLDEVGRYLHLNPVRVGGLGLGKEDQRRARVLGCKNPGQELVSRRIAALRSYPWSSWRVYAGLEASMPWLCQDRLQSGCGGGSLLEQRRALTTFTESPIRQGVMESPWVGLVAGIVLGSQTEAQRVLEKAKGDRRQQTPVRHWEKQTRPAWAELIHAAEEILGRPWREMIRGYSDWGRDGLLAVSTRYLGWGLAESVRLVPGLGYAAAAQGIRRFWQRAPKCPKRQAFVEQLRSRLSKV